MIEFSADLLNSYLLSGKSLYQSGFCDGCGFSSVTKCAIWICSPGVYRTILRQSHGETTRTAYLVNTIELLPIHIKPKNQVFHQCRCLHWRETRILEAQLSALITSKGVHQSRSRQYSAMIIATRYHLYALSTLKHALSRSDEELLAHVLSQLTKLISTPYIKVRLLLILAPARLCALHLVWYSSISVCLYSLQGLHCHDLLAVVGWLILLELSSVLCLGSLCLAWIQTCVYAKVAIWTIAWHLHLVVESILIWMHRLLSHMWLVLEALAKFIRQVYRSSRILTHVMLDVRNLWKTTKEWSLVLLVAEVDLHIWVSILALLIWRWGVTISTHCLHEWIMLLSGKLTNSRQHLRILKGSYLSWSIEIIPLLILNHHVHDFMKYFLIFYFLYFFVIWKLKIVLKR